MELIILLIIIFFVWRHFKKKKGSMKSKDTQTASSKTLSKSVSAEHQSGSSSTSSHPVSNEGFAFEGFPLYTPKPMAIGPRRGTAVPKSSLPVKDDPLLVGSEDTKNPDYAFACAEAFYKKYLDKYKAGKFDIDPSTGRTVRVWIEAGDILAKYYEMGYGCERNMQAALDILLELNKYITVQSNKEVRGKESEGETLAFCAGAENLLALGECYACLGKIQESAKFYRMAMASAKMFKYPEIFEQKILNSALGGYPVPANPTLAAELALKLVQQNKVFAAYSMLEVIDLQKMDYQKIGQSCEQDFHLYLAHGRATGSAYAAYKLGECYLYGKGTSQNIAHGLSLLHDASYSDNLNATELISDYLDGLNQVSYRDENGKKLSSSTSSRVDELQSQWMDRMWNMQDNTRILSMIQNVIDNHAGAENVIGKRVKPTIFQNIDEEKGDTDIENTSSDFFDFPYLIMDDWNRQWILDWNNGEEARYTLDPNFDQKTDIMDSLSDGVAYLKKADMRSGRATYMGRTFHW